MALERIGRSAFGQERPFEEQAESSHRYRPKSPTAVS